MKHETSFNDLLSCGFWTVAIETVAVGGRSTIVPVNGIYDTESDAIEAARVEIANSGHEQGASKPHVMFHIPYPLLRALGRMKDAQITVFADDVVWRPNASV